VGFGLVLSVKLASILRGQVIEEGEKSKTKRKGKK
jgi:hypothetical protein